MRLMISCGEPSGDLYAAALAGEILRLEPSASITGFGGDRLAAAGRVTIAFDPATGLLAYQRYGGAAGEPTTEETFTDYRSVKGLQIAHHASVRREGQPPLQRTIRTFEVNVPLDPAFFKKPTRKL